MHSLSSLKQSWQISILISIMKKSRPPGIQRLLCNSWSPRLAESGIQTAAILTAKPFFFPNRCLSKCSRISCSRLTNGPRLLARNSSDHIWRVLFMRHPTLQNYRNPRILGHRGGRPGNLHLNKQVKTSTALHRTVLPWE